jgi:hypothetical protein
VTTDKAAVEELDLVRHDLDRARSEAGFLRIHAARAMTMAVAVADSRRHHLEATDQALWAPRAGRRMRRGASLWVSRNILSGLSSRLLFENMTLFRF